MIGCRRLAIHTVDAALELLAADSTVQCANTCFLVELHSDRLFVIAEEAGKDARKGFVLRQRMLVR